MKALTREALTLRWRHLCRLLGAPPEGCDKAFLFLYEAYDQKQRAYHNLQHLSECLETLDSLGEIQENLRPSLEFALWYHDVIYDVLSARNEDKSADSALRQLSEWGRPATQQCLIRSLILATRHQTLPSTPAEGWMVDIDLAILASPTPRYQLYERQIRQEYRAVPWFTYRQKRGEVLSAFLNRPHIYSSAQPRKDWEPRARANLAWSLENLKNPEGPA